MAATTRDGRKSLETDHHHLDRLLASVEAGARSDDAIALLAAWNAFERQVLAHLDAEEMVILPIVATEHPAEAEWLRAEHNAIRHDLGEIGLAIDLRTVRAESIEQLAQRLRDHARRESDWLYPWVDKSLDERRTAYLSRRLRAGWDRARDTITHIAERLEPRGA